MRKRVKTKKDFEQFVKYNNYEYKAIDLEITDNYLWIRFIIKKNDYELIGIVSPTGVFLPCESNLILGEDEELNEKCEMFLNKIEEDESFIKFWKNVYGELANKNAVVSGICVCDEDDDNKYLGNIVFDEEKQKICFY